MITLQEMFSEIITGLRKQGKKSKNTERTICMYSSADGCKCALGMLIKDDCYSHAIEGRNIWDAHVEKALENSGIDIKTMAVHRMLSDMQYSHDSVLISDWELEWRKIAREYGLTVPA